MTDIHEVDKYVQSLTLLHLAVSDQRSPSGRFLAMRMLQDLCVALRGVGIDTKVISAIHLQDPMDHKYTFCGQTNDVDTLFCNQCLSSLTERWGIGWIYKTALTQAKKEEK